MTLKRFLRVSSIAAIAISTVVGFEASSALAYNQTTSAAFYPSGWSVQHGDPIFANGVAELGLDAPAVDVIQGRSGFETAVANYSCSTNSLGQPIHAWWQSAFGFDLFVWGKQMPAGQQTNVLSAYAVDYTTGKTSLIASFNNSGAVNKWQRWDIDLSEFGGHTVAIKFARFGDSGDVYALRNGAFWSGFNAEPGCPASPPYGQVFLEQ